MASDGARRPSLIQRAVGLVKDTIVSVVNPRFRCFTYALSIALFVGILTLCGTAAITYIIYSDCTMTCRSIPMALVSQESLDDLKCVGLRSRALTLSISMFDNVRELSPTKATIDQSWHSFKWGTSGAAVGKCSFLHATDCGLREWLGFYKGMLALGTVISSEATQATAAWPTASAIMDFTKTADAMIATVLALDNKPLLTKAVAQQYISGVILGPDVALIQVCNFRTSWCNTV